MLSDSNIIIYAAKPEHSELRRFVAEHAPAVSAISYVEVLGYHQFSAQERQLFETYFANTNILPISQAVLEQAVRLRQRKKMTLGDSIVAATCLVYNKTLVTHNTKDFARITELSVIDPL